MKKTIIAALLISSSTIAIAQGQSHYATSATGLNTQRSDSTGIAPSVSDLQNPLPVSNQNQLCVATTASWSQNGNACSASIPSTASGQYAVASSTNGNTGQASYSCSNGTFTGVSSTCDQPAATNPSPTPVTPAAKDCPQQTVTWPIANFCSGIIPAAPPYSVLSVTSSAFHRYGVGTFQCFDGAWKLQNNTCY